MNYFKKFNVGILNKELKIEANLGSNKCSKFVPKINYIPILEKIIIWSISSPNLPYVVCKLQPSNTQGFNVNLSPNNRYICILIWCLNSAPNQPQISSKSAQAQSMILHVHTINNIWFIWIIHWSKRASTWMESWRGHCDIILGQKKKETAHKGGRKTCTKVFSKLAWFDFPEHLSVFCP